MLTEMDRVPLLERSLQIRGQHLVDKGMRNPGLCQRQKPSDTARSFFTDK